MLFEKKSDFVLETGDALARRVEFALDLRVFKTHRCKDGAYLLLLSDEQTDGDRKELQEWSVKHATLLIDKRILSSSSTSSFSFFIFIFILFSFFFILVFFILLM